MVNALINFLEILLYPTKFHGFLSKSLPVADWSWNIVVTMYSTLVIVCLLLDPQRKGLSVVLRSPWDIFSVTRMKPCVCFVNK